MSVVAAQQAFSVFIWFLLQCLTVGGLGAGLFWIPAAAVLALMVRSFRKSPPAARRRSWWLSSLPMFWILIGMWGSVFRVDINPGRSHPNPHWVIWPIDYGPYVFVAVSVILIAYLKHGRTFAALFVAINFYLLLGMTLLAGMAVSGNWL